MWAVIKETPVQIWVVRITSLWASTQNWQSASGDIWCKQYGRGQKKAVVNQYLGVWSAHTDFDPGAWLKQACRDRSILLVFVLLVVAQQLDATSQSQQRSVYVSSLLQSLACCVGLGMTFRARQVAQWQPAQSLVSIFCFGGTARLWLWT